jgi:hypothetical protein
MVRRSAVVLCAYPARETGDDAIMAGQGRHGGCGHSPTLVLSCGYLRAVLQLFDGDHGAVNVTMIVREHEERPVCALHGTRHMLLIRCTSARQECRPICVAAVMPVGGI